MWIIQYFDWAGTADELEKQTEIVKKACDEVDFVTFKAHTVPYNSKWHFAWIFKATSFDKFAKMGAEMPRDYNKMTHAEVEILI